MVVLLRAFTHLDAYEDSLERAGLRPYVVGGRGYWSQQQVADVCALLATIANPLDDQALFGALASPACGVAPDTLWLLRAAAGRRRHVWPALERAGRRRRGGAGRARAARRRSQPRSWSCCGTLRRCASARLRERGPRLSLAALIEAAVTETGYDLAVLLRAGRRGALRQRAQAVAARRRVRGARGPRPARPARLPRRPGRRRRRRPGGDRRRGPRRRADHDRPQRQGPGVRGRRRPRPLAQPAGRVAAAAAGPGTRGSRRGSGCSCGGSAAPRSTSTTTASCCEEAKRRDSEEGLRLFHVAATRARRAPDPERRRQARARARDEAGHSRSSSAWSRRSGSGARPTRPWPCRRRSRAPASTPSFAASEIAVRVNLPSPERAAELRATRRDAAADRALGAGPPPLVDRQPPIVPSRPLSYTAISAYEECGYRFYMERVLGLPATSVRSSVRMAGGKCERSGAESGRRRPSAREERERPRRRRARAAGVEPGQRLGRAERGAGAAATRSRRGSSPARPTPRSCWSRCASGSPPRSCASGSPGADRVRAEVPLLLGVGGTVLRGSIDLLVEREGAPPLVVDYKTDRLGDEDPGRPRRPLRDPAGDLRARQRRRRSAPSEVEVAYVFLERPEEPGDLPASEPRRWGAGRERLAASIARIAAGEFPVAPEERPRLGPVPRLSGPRPSVLRARGRLTKQIEDAGSAVCSAHERPRTRRCAGQAASESSFAASSSSFSSFSPSPTASSSAAQ